MPCHDRISVDNEVKYDIKNALTNDFDDRWWNLGEVPQEQKDKWWSDFVMMELGEEPSITDLVRKTMKLDGTFADKRAKMIVDKVESIVVSQQLNNTEHVEVGSQETNSHTPITPLMQDEAFYSMVKPYKGRVFGLRSAQMESYDPIDPPSLVLPRQARYERDLELST
ncbi:unnamed protein product [Microthlaspi erraticum]|uniref:Uncharacterized protein n=1 Tax=Microthlaspi erraticum TaxID=1685480 RepID=A0A6D2KWE1_9BRAS|nr:unnamed protein product [Microthlaspi erraticum]CAA7057582.1 unnamed protein product [Microthlaspi erraticum]